MSAPGFFKKAGFNPLCVFFISLVILLLDYITGPHIEFPVLFIIPVVLAAWGNSIAAGVIYSVLLPLVTLYFMHLWNSGVSPAYTAINISVRVTVLLIIVYMISIIKKQQHLLSERINKLEKILPICSHCKKIRDKNNAWHNVENYIGDKTDTRFSHSICPECAERHYKDYLPKK